MPLTATVETSSLRAGIGGAVLADSHAANCADLTMARMRARFPRTSKLLRHADFERVYKQGRRHFSASMTVFYWPRTNAEKKKSVPASEAASVRSGLQESAVPGLRVGFTVGRALGGAVERNRMKRRLREAVRLSGGLSGLAAECAADVVINPKKSLLKADFADVVHETRRAFEVIAQKLSAKTAERTGANATGRVRESGSRS